MTKILIKTNQLHLGIVLTQKVQNNYLIPFVTSFCKCEQKTFSLKKNLFSSGVFWNDYDCKNMYVCVFLCLSCGFVCVSTCMYMCLCVFWTQ